MAVTVQKAALRVILRVLNGEHVQVALDNVLDSGTIAINDKTLCTDLVYGYLRSQIRLEFILRQFLQKPQILPENMYIMLSLAVYSLLLQERVPAYAVVHQTVGQIAKEYGKKLAAVANGTLRSIQRLGNILLEPQWYIDKMDGKSFAALSVFYGIPVSIAHLWRNSYGAESAINLMRRSFARPYKAMRINLSHPQADELFSYLKTLDPAKVVQIGKAGFAFAPGYLSEKTAEDKLQEWYKKGCFSWQSAASMLVLENLGIFDWKINVWDCCAGVGGKSIGLLERNVEVSLASDINYRRLKRIFLECARLHINSPYVALMDAALPAVGKWTGNIIMDAPCSGLGVLARRPDIRHKFCNREFSPSDYINIQLRMLAALKECMSQGRKLAYITCTLNPAENEELIGKFLKNEPHMHLVREWQTPHEHPWLEGMYGAVLEKC